MFGVGAGILLHVLLEPLLEIVLQPGYFVLCGSDRLERGLRLPVGQLGLRAEGHQRPPPPAEHAFCGGQSPAPVGPLEAPGPVGLVGGLGPGNERKSVRLEVGRLRRLQQDVTAQGRQRSLHRLRPGEAVGLEPVLRGQRRHGMVEVSCWIRRPEQTHHGIVRSGERVAHAVEGLPEFLGVQTLIRLTHRAPHPGHHPPGGGRPAEVLGGVGDPERGRDVEDHALERLSHGPFPQCLHQRTERGVVEDASVDQPPALGFVRRPRAEPEQLLCLPDGFEGEREGRRGPGGPGDAVARGREVVPELGGAVRLTPEPVDAAAVHHGRLLVALQTDRYGVGLKGGGGDQQRAVLARRHGGTGRDVVEEGVHLPVEHPAVEQRPQRAAVLRRSAVVGHVLPCPVRIAQEPADVQRSDLRPLGAHVREILPPGHGRGQEGTVEPAGAGAGHRVDDRPAGCLPEDVGPGPVDGCLSRVVRSRAGIGGQPEPVELVRHPTHPDGEAHAPVEDDGEARFPYVPRGGGVPRVLILGGRRLGHGLSLRSAPRPGRPAGRS